MAFMLRVRLDCPNDEVSSTLLDALKTFARLQTEHTGVVTYHFVRPEPQKRPYYFEFTEVYGNEATFWAHSSNSEFTDAYGRVFIPANKITSVTYGYGPGLEGKVKEVINVVLPKVVYPQATAGFVLNPQEWDVKNEEGSPIMVIARIQAKEGKSGEILQLLTKLSEDANSGVLVCHGSVPEEEKGPNSIELVEVCTTNGHLMSHFCSAKGKETLQAMSQVAESITCEGYGSVLPTTVQLFASELGLQLVAIATDAGYVLHPNADPAGQ